MKTTSSTGLLLVSSALISSAAWAQDMATTVDDQQVEISAPGLAASDEVIVVQGRNIPEPIRATAEVVSVLSAAEIARTGDGDIAGALQRVTGLSLVGGRFVYVRGLGERYSLALLNGLPLPSPEPLRRVVPLDIFPTDVIASSVVQKSYSVNYPGEFGGGVINLTTTAIPEESFLKVEGSLSGNSETTFERGYTYFGSDTDFTGFDDGSRSIPQGLAAAMKSGNRIQVGENFTLDQVKGFTASLLNAPSTLIQRNDNIPMNGAIDISAGLAFDIGSDRLGIIAAFGWDNSWETRGGLQQRTIGLYTDSDGEDKIRPDTNLRFMSTENKVVVHGLFGVGYEFGPHKLRWTNLFIRDTSKEARIQDGIDEIQVGSDRRVNRSFTNWFERQLIDTQAVAEFKFGDVAIDLRGTYANTQRTAPYERSFSYIWDDTANDFVNALGTTGQQATVSFSDLNEDVWAGNANLSWRLPTTRPITLSAGYAYTDTTRTSERRDFEFRSRLGTLPLAVAQQRPDYLLSDYNVYTYDVILFDQSSADQARYDAGLTIHAGYGQIEVELADFIRATVGVRYEDATQFVDLVDIFGLGGGAGQRATQLANYYFLPAATLTWNFAEDMQFRLAASKTIARPQFRELAQQQYFDTESDRTFTGNPYLTDSELLNFEGRYEWYIGQNERISLAGFYKKIDKPIEAIATQQGQTPFTTFANAPEAQLYGVEAELQKYFALGDRFGGTVFATRDILLGVNYTYSQSKIKVSADDTTIPYDRNGAAIPASDLFRNGTKMTGQSDHILNVQIGLEDSERLSQQTLMLTYASKRLSNRFSSADGTPIDFIENPGFRLDFVARQGISIGGREFEVKFAARNLTGQDNEEYQAFNGTRVDRNTYDLGRSYSLGISTTF